MRAFPGCALCGDVGSPGVNVPVIRPDASPGYPRVCQHCLSMLIGVVFQLAGHAHELVAQAVISVQDTGHH